MKLVFLLLVFFISCKISASSAEVITTQRSSVLHDCEKCDIEMVKKTEQNISTLSDDLLESFLCGFDKQCYTNAEYSEYSNEVLYMVVIKQPKKLLKVIESIFAKGNDVSIIYSELSSPLLDYDYDSLIEVYRQIQGSMKVKKEVINSLEKAKQG